MRARSLWSKGRWKPYVRGWFWCIIVTGISSGVREMEIWRDLDFRSYFPVISRRFQGFIYPVWQSRQSRRIRFIAILTFLFSFFLWRTSLISTTLEDLKRLRKAEYKIRRLALRMTKKFDNEMVSYIWVIVFITNIFYFFIFL